jgi:hypothetical protein
MAPLRLIGWPRCGKPPHDRDKCVSGSIDIASNAGNSRHEMRAILPIPLILMLAACGSEEVARPVAAISQPVTRLPHHAPAHDTVLGSVIGADADALVREFGTPRLDIHDGNARKLQWSGTACILDAYLYPGDRGGRPTATFVDTRRGDGRDVDRTACITALRKN